MLRTLLVVSLSLAACSSSLAVGKLPAHPNRELAILREGAAQANAAPFTLLALYGQYAASHRDYEAYLFFHQRAAEQPDQPLFLTLEAVFMARVANDVPLLSRVAWVEDAIAKLDRAVKVDPVLSRYLRGIVLAELPERFHKERDAIADLEWFLAEKEKFPYGLRRPAYLGLAKAHATLGDTAKSQAALKQSTYPAIDPELANLTTDTLVSRTGGARFGAPRLLEPVPGVFVAQGFGFSDFAFVVTGKGIVAIDAGSSEADAAAALEALRAKTQLPITHLVLTHAHYDHVGGLAAYRRAFPKLELIGHAGSGAEVALQNATGVPYRSFRGGAPGALALTFDRAVAKNETLTVGDVQLALYPLRGGETEDTLIIDVPARHVVFTGDALMPYAGAPFFPEGSAQGLLDAIALTRSLKPALVVHGHTAMTERWPAESLEGLEAALKETFDRVVAGVAKARPLPELLDADLFPSVLKAQPRAVIPYVATREGFVRRLFHERTGYWTADPGTVEVLSDAAWAEALDQIAGSSDGALASAGERLLAQGDFVLAQRVATLGLSTHPGSAALKAVQQRALTRLREQNEQINPFKFIVYTEWADAEVLPMP